MDIKEFLSPDRALIDVRASDKPGLLRDLSGRAAVVLGVAADRIASELLKREELGSTGTGGGVAVPHARMAEVTRPFGILARLKNPIDLTPSTVNMSISCSCYCFPSRRQVTSSRRSRALPANCEPQARFSVYVVRSTQQSSTLQ